MTQEDQPFFFDENNAADVMGSNTPEFSVSEISQTLKQTVEDRFSHIRVRGEISRVTVAKSGHMYSSLKDDKAVLDMICWKGTVSRLSFRPEEGMEVICTGRLSTYPGRSNYQMIVESMEIAGEGALLKMLEDRRKKLAAEGLFDADRKKPLPFIPRKIGVVTSPTGAVIRDIMHRLNDRFPTHVMLFPAVVQGENAVKHIVEGIQSFNRIPETSPDRPDLIIVARGGGSLEDLMPFNDEAVVRAVADSQIPLISAVGHETDTTLIDYAADLRAPTPTGAAELAVPVRSQLAAQLMDDERRAFSAMMRTIDHLKTRLEGLGRGLGNPAKILESVTQKLDHLSGKLDHCLLMGIEKRGSVLGKLDARLSPNTLLNTVKQHHKNVDELRTRMTRTLTYSMEKRSDKLVSLSSLLETLSFKKVLARGFSYVENANGLPVGSAVGVNSGDHIDIHFHDGKRHAVIEKDPGMEFKRKNENKRKPKPKAPAPKSGSDQGSLF